MLLNLLRAIQKAANLSETAELVAQLLNTIGEISKTFYTKAAGIDPIFMKGMIPLFGSLFKETSNPEALLSALKCFGIFVNQASIVPVRMQQFYKDIIELNYDTDLCAILLKASSKPTAIEMTVCHVIA